jgi:hypothetical protein
VNLGTEKVGRLIYVEKEEGRDSKGAALGPLDFLVAGRDEGPGSALTVSLRTGSAVIVSLRTALMRPLNFEPLIFRLFGSNLVLSASSGIIVILPVSSLVSNGFLSTVVVSFSVKKSSRILFILPPRTFFMLFPGTFSLMPPGTFFMLPRMLRIVPRGIILFRRTWILDSRGDDTFTASVVVSDGVGSERDV